MSGRRVALVGIDGFSPVWMDKFLMEGKLPAIGSLTQKGVRVSLISTLPATTPVAWATIATGCSPATTGIEGFLLHQPGNILDQRFSGCYSSRCRVEPIWETATLAGKRSYIVKFPLSYPSSTATFRLDGAAGWGGLKCLHEAASSSIASTENVSTDSRLVISDKKWLSEMESSGRETRYFEWILAALWDKEPIVLYIAASETAEEGVVISIADAPDQSHMLCSIKEGEWSDPLTIKAKGRRGETDCCFRVKVLSYSQNPPHLRIVNTTIHERLGHSEPSEIWNKYIDIVGPIEEQTEPDLFLFKGLDLETQLEIFRLNAEWLKQASINLIQNEPWDLFMVHAHFIDWAHHMLHGAIDDRHPDFDSLKAPKYENALLESYQLADELVAAICEAVGTDVDVIVMGDHGQDIHHTTFRANEWLADQGLLRWEGDGMDIDWAQTQAYTAGNYIYLNLDGREPTGIVSQSAAEKVKKTIIDRLLSLTDPLTNTRPVLIAGGKYDFEYLGAHGKGVGDIVFCLRSGYEARNDRGDIFTKTKALHEFTSGHDHFWPLDPCIQTRLFASGPSFRQKYDHPRIESLTNVAPTICRILGILPSMECEGQAIVDLLQNSGISDLELNRTAQFTDVLGL